MPLTYQAIATVTVGAGGAASISFSSIPQTYTDLLIKTSLRDTASGIANAGMRVIFNGASTGFSSRLLYGNGTTAFSFTDSGSWIRVGQQPASSSTANTFSNDEVYIPNYSAAGNKTLSADSVSENNATESYATIVAGLWSNTAAITSIVLQSNSTSWAQHSTATLYGIKKD